VGAGDGEYRVVVGDTARLSAVAVTAKKGTNAMPCSPHVRSISSLTRPKSTPYLFCTQMTGAISWRTWVLADARVTCCRWGGCTVEER
jgi:hypothetical protein